MEEFIRKLSDLLDLEREAELTENQQLISQFNVKELEHKGICLRKLCIASQRCGFYGRTVLKLEPSKHLKPSSDTNGQKSKIFSAIFHVGDIVSIFTASLPSENSGVITHITPTSITVAFDQSPFSEHTPCIDDTNLSLVKVNSDVTHKRLKRGLETLLDSQQGTAKQIISVCFYNTPLLHPNPKYHLSEKPFLKDLKKCRIEDEFEVSLFNSSLNTSQTQAVIDTLSRQDISIIHGPPGTGKTTTVVECIIQCVIRSHKVLACAPSNIAVDNLLTKLAPLCKVVRLGHPARAASQLQKFTLDALVNSSDSFDVIKQVRNDIDKALGVGSKKKQRVNWSEVRELRKELHQREHKVIYEILNSCDVVLSTTTSASIDGPLKSLPKEHFGAVFIDECAQATEPACWIPLLHSAKCVLAGDHNQLPPTIISEEAAKKGLAVTLMERIIRMHGNRMVSFLATQYRMNSLIMQWPSEYLYEGKLMADESVSSQLLCQMQGVESNPYTQTPLLFIDTAGCELYELDVPEEISKSNEGEAKLVSLYVSSLIKFGLPLSAIAVIAPYSLQVELIAQKLDLVNISGVEVRTVDGFQGREKEAVIISFTRSNLKGEIGFLREVRRTNVAITRAKRHLCVIGDSFTISNQEFIKGLLNQIEEKGDVKSGFDFLNEDLVVAEDSTPKLCIRKPQKLENKIKFNQNAKDDGHFALIKEKERKLENRIRQFSEDESTEKMEFSVNLTSKERYLVHKLAEELNLFHSSSGEGKERKIIISKTDIEDPSAIVESDPIIEKDEFNIADLNSGNVIETRSSDAIINQALNEHETIETLSNEETYNLSINSLSDSTCEICGKSLPKENIIIHQVRCQRMKEINKRVDTAIKSVKSTQNKKSKASNKPKTTHAKSNQISQKDVKKKLNLEDDFAVLEAAIQLKEVCNFKDCNQSTKLIGQYCEYCKLHYCMKHCQYEIHGCSSMARSDSRYTAIETARKIPKKQREDLETKYQKQLQEKAKERKGKNRN